MRILSAVALLVPLLAGCANLGDGGVRIEAFSAAYQVTGEGGELRYVANVTFGDVVEYVDADGRVRQGYAVTVDYGAHAWRACGREAILGNDLGLRRLMWGNGWNEKGECVHEQYDWVVPGMPWPRLPAFGVGLNVNPPMDAEVVGNTVIVANDTYRYDGMLAPTSFPMGGLTATRSSYTSSGPLTPLTESTAMAPLALLPLDGPGLPGGDGPLPGLPFSLDEALAYARANDANAGRLLDAGACITAFFLHAYREAGSSDLPLAVTASDAEETTMTFGLSDGHEASGFRVAYGRKAPLGERGFLSVGPTESEGQIMECTRRTPVAALPQQFGLIADREPSAPWFVYGIWQTQSQPEPWFQLVADTDMGRLTVDGTHGVLQSWHLARDTPIDP